MTEKNLWTRIVRPALHDPPRSLAYKVQDAFVKGLPDVVAQQGGWTYWIELKTLDHAPVREDTPWRVGVTTEQRRWLMAWNRAAGAVDMPTVGTLPAFVLLWVDRDKTWYALAPDIPETVDQDSFESYIITSGTKDQLRERLFP